MKRQPLPIGGLAPTVAASPCSRPSQRAMVVVLAEGVTESHAANVRGGLRAMAGVERVVPLEGMPDERGALEAIRQDVMGESFAELELVRQQRDELASRLAAAKDALSGPIPLRRWESVGEELGA